MSPKNQIYALAATAIVLGGATAYLAYRNYTVKSEFTNWVKTLPSTTTASMPKVLRDMLPKVAA